MNRRKFLLGTAGVAVSGVALAKSTPRNGVHIHQGCKVRWVKSTKSYDAMRKGWQEHPDHITRFWEPDGLAHLMTRRG